VLLLRDLGLGGAFLAAKFFELGRASSSGSKSSRAESPAVDFSEIGKVPQ
jgi:hypothetical protein